MIPQKEKGTSSLLPVSLLPNFASNFHQTHIVTRCEVFRKTRVKTFVILRHSEVFFCRPTRNENFIMIFLPKNNKIFFSNWVSIVFAWMFERWFAWLARVFFNKIRRWLGSSGLWFRQKTANICCWSSACRFEVLCSTVIVHQF